MVVRLLLPEGLAGSSQGELGDGDPALIDWFDVVAPDTYDTAPFHGKLTIDPVALQHANGVYSDPEWTSGENLPQDWIDFIAGVIERSRKIRQHVEAAPHQLEHA